MRCWFCRELVGLHTFWENVWSCCIAGPQGYCKYQVVVIKFLSGILEFLYFWSQNPIAYAFHNGSFVLFPGTESSMAIKSQNFQRACLKDSFLCNCCEYFFIYSILGSFKRVNMMRDLCQKKNWQEIPNVRSKYSRTKLC